MTGSERAGHSRLSSPQWTRCVTRTYATATSCGETGFATEIGAPDTQARTASASASARSVRSQVNSGRLRPKWP
jgi:hypothetical protein